MRDNEIIKALNGADGLEHICIYCADNNGEDVCTIKLIDIIDLINRLQAENERLQTERDFYKAPSSLLAKGIEKIKSEAIKEFAEKLKSQFHISCYYNCIYIRAVINDHVKEMTEVSENDL